MQNSHIFRSGKKEFCRSLILIVIGVLFRSHAWMPSSSHVIRPASKLLATKRWNVGDSVVIQIRNKNKNTLQHVAGNITSSTGNGWHTIHCAASVDDDDDDQQIHRRRTSELLSEFPSSDTTEVSESSPAQQPASASQQQPPKVIDLDSILLSNDLPIESFNGTTRSEKMFLEQVAHYASQQKWVVFSDLHCSPSTVDTCLQVLKTVHAVAVERNAGVIFLGDFWHHRGTLRVDCLNAVLHTLRTWQVPMIMIAGNHDQVTLGGDNHGLTPLENAYHIQVNNNNKTVPGPLVFSYPTKFANALFVPYCRESETAAGILQSSQAVEATAIFVHADVRGAYMNDLKVSESDMLLQQFPAGKPIFSGHFHKPHTIRTSTKGGGGRGVSIEYVGSPYQTSLSEAQQLKSLILLDASKGWTCIERIPITIGKHHFRTSPQQVLDLVLGNRSNKSLSAAVNKQLLVEPGDRVVVSMATRDDHVAVDGLDAHIESLRKAGVSVEIRDTRDQQQQQQQQQSQVLETTLEDLSPEALWKEFLAQDERQGTEEHQAVLEQAGLEILEQVGSTKRVLSSSAQSEMVDLRLESVTVQGYGPFKREVTYPLQDRGLVLLRGTNKDGGSDSNGSGKTSLAMAALWALTGSVDPRPLQDSKVSDVVNDSSKTAQVSLKGTMNGSSFSITRTKSTRKSNLSFLYDGVDFTAQTVTETAVQIQEKLGVNPSTLARAAFHGQHSINDLLEATDSLFKEELSLIVPVTLWQEATSLSRSKTRDAQAKVSELKGMLKVRTEDQKILFLKCQQTKEILDKQKIALDAKEEQFEREMEKAGIYDVEHGELNMEELQVELKEASKILESIKREHTKILDESEAQITLLQRALAEHNEATRQATLAYEKLDLEYNSQLHLVGIYRLKIQELETTWGFDLSNRKPYADMIVLENCPLCHQPLQNSDDGRSSSDLQASIMNDIESALAGQQEGNLCLQNMSVALSLANETLSQDKLQMLQLQDELDVARSSWNEKLQASRKEMEQRQRDQSSLAEKVTLAAQQFQQRGKKDTLEVQIQSERESYAFALDSYTQFAHELLQLESSIKGLEDELEETKSIAEIMSKLSDAFGSRGVQAFVLNHAISALEMSTRSFLDTMSGDGAQRLELSLDGNDRIVRKAFVLEAHGEFKERPLASLSGGQWRRCSLALNLGFADLMARRGRLRPSLLVLDEPLTHLDRSGRADVGKVLRQVLSREKASSVCVSTIIVILQDLSAEELEEAFDRMDEVVKHNGESTIVVDA